MPSKLTRILSRPWIGESLVRVVSASLLLVTTGCITSSFNPRSSTERYLDSGTLGLTRPLPGTSTSFSEPMARMRPPQTSPSESLVPKLIIENANRSLTLALPGEAPITMTANGTFGLQKGTYSIALKQTDPLWYAPPTYFLRRGMKVPAEGSKARFMRGALGHQALFLDKQTAIHSGPVWNDEIGGIKLSRDDMSRLFTSVSVGTKVEVR